MRLLWVFLVDVIVMKCMSLAGDHLLGLKPFSAELVAILAFVCTYFYNEEKKKNG